MIPPNLKSGIIFILTHLAYVLFSFRHEDDPVYSCDKCGAIFLVWETCKQEEEFKKSNIFRMLYARQIVLPSLKDSPEFLWHLLTSDDELSKHFRENIRAYNTLFSFTSIGSKVDHFLPKGPQPNMFAIQGENYHLIGALKPKSSAKAKFQQLYIADTENEVNNRYNIMRYLFFYFSIFTTIQFSSTSIN